MTAADIKALKAALAARKAELEEATALVKSVQARLDEVRHDAQRAAESVAEAEIALRLAQPLGKRLAKLLAESAEEYGARIGTFGGKRQRGVDASELRLLGLADVRSQDFRGYYLAITDAGRAKLAEEAGQ